MTRAQKELLLVLGGLAALVVLWLILRKRGTVQAAGLPAGTGELSPVGPYFQAAGTGPSSLSSTLRDYYDRLAGENPDLAGTSGGVLPAPTCSSVSALLGGGETPAYAPAAPTAAPAPTQPSGGFQYYGFAGVSTG